jgi:poly-gamma-glutamate synthesis protein (capsule biosynthesis protein)
MREMCRRFLSFGADAVIAHHAHVPQGVEVLPDGVICYSLGNFVFDIPEHDPYPGTRLGYMVRLGASPDGIGEITILPTVKRSDFTVRWAEGTIREDFFSLLNSISAPLADEDRSREIWREYVRRDAPQYLSMLRKHASSLGGDLRSLPEEDARLLYAYLAGCRTHREITSESVRLLFEGKMQSIGWAGELIDGWEEAVSDIVQTVDS